jgi:hypothetical protein
MIRTTWADYVGHILQGWSHSGKRPADFLVVEYNADSGLYLVEISDESHGRHRCISERAVDRTYHHLPRKCAGCVQKRFVEERGTMSTFNFFRQNTEDDASCERAKP